MSQIKIIFFDIDGTLIDMQKKQISDKTLETLKRLRENGIKICIATGRTPISVPVFEGVQFDAYLTFNGSFCYSGENVVFSNPICSKDVRKIIENAKNMGKPISIATRNRIAANGTDEDLARYYSFAHQTLTVAEDFEKVCQEEIYQLMAPCREDEYEEILRDVKGTKIAAWWDKAVDIIPANGGKGMGIQKILEFYNFNKSEALAFGDGNNDIEMLQAVGHGVAMENASPGLKVVADEVCGHVAEDGIYHYCVKRGFI